MTLKDYIGLIKIENYKIFFVPLSYGKEDIHVSGCFDSLYSF